MSENYSVNRRKSSGEEESHSTKVDFITEESPNMIMEEPVQPAERRAVPAPVSLQNDVRHSSFASATPEFDSQISVDHQGQNEYNINISFADSTDQPTSTQRSISFKNKHYKAARQQLLEDIVPREEAVNASKFNTQHLYLMDKEHFHPNIRLISLYYL